MSNQDCYVCGKPCRPGAGLTDNKGRRHITCPVLNPKQLAQRQLALAKANSRRQSAAATQGIGMPVSEGGMVAQDVTH